MPDTLLPTSVLVDAYPVEAMPVFFGHCWLVGTPVPQSANATCLDYSAGRDGPLLTYRFETGDARIDGKNLYVHAR